MCVLLTDRLLLALCSCSTQTHISTHPHCCVCTTKHTHLLWWALVLPATPTTTKPAPAAATTASAPASKPSHSAGTSGRAHVCTLWSVLNGELRTGAESRLLLPLLLLSLRRNKAAAATAAGLSRGQQHASAQCALVLGVMRLLHTRYVFSARQSVCSSNDLMMAVVVFSHACSPYEVFATL